MCLYMADWTPPPNPSEPPQGGYPPPFGTYDPFAGAPQYEDQTSLGGTPLVQPGQPTPPPFQQPPQPQFQQQPGYPQYGQQPYGQQPYGQQPPPPASNAGKVLAIGLAFVVVIGGLIGIVFMLKSDKKPDNPPIAVTSAPVVTPSQSAAVPDPVPSSSDPVPDPSAEAVTVPTDLLGATVKTFWKETFIRVGAATGTCPVISPPSLDRLLQEHPCAGPFRGATYTNAKKSVVVVVVVMPMSGKADADALKNSKLYPELIPPKAGSGLPSLKGKNISTWVKTTVTGGYVVYGMSYQPNGKAAKAGGVVQTSAAHLAAELASVLVWRS